MVSFLTFVACTVFWYLGFSTGRSWERNTKAKYEALQARAAYLNGFFRAARKQGTYVR